LLKILDRKLENIIKLLGLEKVMARFITEEKQKNITKSSFLHYLLLIIIVMEFIRLPDVFGLPPVYFVTGLCPLIILFDLKKLPSISPIIIKIILLLLFYNVYVYLLAWGLDIQNGKSEDAARQLGVSIKKFIQFLLFLIACTNLIELRRVIFTITITIFISAVFGLLTYYFGGPFEEIRDWLWQSRADLLSIATEENKGGKGQFVTGLSGVHWLFGYLMTAGPALALICGRLSRFKWLWAVIFLVMFFALYLNGQRAAFAFSCLAIIALIIYWRLVTMPFIFIGVAFVLSIYIFSFGNTQSAQIYHASNEELSLLDRFSHSGHDSDDRFSWWKAGVISVIESPWIGPTHEEYVGAFFGTKTVIVANNPDRRIPFAHNSYINPGIYIGIIGWLIVLFYLIILKKILAQVFTAETEEKQEKIIFQGISITLLAPMLNAMFQNDSIFYGEPTNVLLTGLLMSCYQIASKQNSIKNFISSKNNHA
jgi:hypothetical protein